MRIKELFLVLLVVLVVPFTTFAQLEPTEESPLADSEFVITCEDGLEIVVSSRIVLRQVSPEFSYRFTAVGIDDYDPVLAVITGPGSGSCNDNVDGLGGSQIAVPGIGFVEANDLSAQVTARTSQNQFGDVEVAVGGLAGSTGQFAVVIEGFRISPNTELDQVLISVPGAAANESLGVFMIGRTEALNPIMRLYDGSTVETGNVDLSNLSPLAICDDGGTDSCVMTPTLNGGGAALETGNVYIADGLDAGIIYTPRAISPLLYTFGSSEGASSGDYVVVVTGTAPGDPDDPAAICNNVAASIERVSSNYSSLYLPENLLDNDPSTGWATTIGPVDATTGLSSTEEFVVVRLNGIHRVSRVRLNTYSPTEGFEENSIRAFSIAVQNADLQQVTVFNGEATLQPGYHTYSFLPIEVDMIAFVFRSNYGGGFFEVADIQVCAEN